VEGLILTLGSLFTGFRPDGNDSLYSEYVMIETGGGCCFNFCM
jgi:hypothetical protein